MHILIRFALLFSIVSNFFTHLEGIDNLPTYVIEMQQYYSRQLAQAAREGDISLMNYWVRSGAQPNARDYMGFPAVYNAVTSRNQQAVCYLLTIGADPNACAVIQGNTPLHYAAANGLIHITALLLERGADPRKRNDLECRPADVTSNATIKTMLVQKAAALDAATE